MEQSKVAFCYPELDSTNSEALRRLKKSPFPAQWTTIQALYQTAGRGQGNNGWFSSPRKNLLCSFIHYPPGWEVENLFRLTQVQSLCVRAMISKTLNHQGNSSAKVSIKWPNDIYINDQKVAGILIQNSLLGKKIQWSVLGLGLNVNETDFPADLTPKATSIRLSIPGKPELDLDRCLELVFATLKSKFAAFASPSSFVKLNEDYHTHLYRRNEIHRYQRTETGEIFTATLLGVDSNGQLILQLTDGHRELFQLKSIAFL